MRAELSGLANELVYFWPRAQIQAQRPLCFRRHSDWPGELQAGLPANRSAISLAAGGEMCSQEEERHPVLAHSQAGEFEVVIVNECVPKHQNEIPHPSSQRVSTSFSLQYLLWKITWKTRKRENALQTQKTNLDCCQCWGSNQCLRALPQSSILKPFSLRVPRLASN